MVQNKLDHSQTRYHTIYPLLANLLYILTLQVPYIYSLIFVFNSHSKYSCILIGIKFEKSNLYLYIFFYFSTNDIFFLWAHESIKNITLWLKTKKKIMKSAVAIYTLNTLDGNFKNSNSKIFFKSYGLCLRLRNKQWFWF